MQLCGRLTLTGMTQPRVHICGGGASQCGRRILVQALVVEVGVGGVGGGGGS